MVQAAWLVLRTYLRAGQQKITTELLTHRKALLQDLSLYEQVLSKAVSKCKHSSRPAL